MGKCLLSAKARQQNHFFLGGKVRDNFWGGFMTRMNISSSASGTHFYKLEFICKVILEISGPKHKKSSVIKSKQFDVLAASDVVVSVRRLFAETTSCLSIGSKTALA